MRERERNVRKVCLDSGGWWRERKRIFEVIKGGEWAGEASMHTVDVGVLLIVARLLIEIIL